MAGMTCFKSFKNGFVTILDNSNDNVEDGTSLAVRPSFIGEWAFQYEPIGDTLHLPQWAIETKCKIIGSQPDSEVLLLQSSHHDKEGDQSTPFPILARKSQDEKATWSNFFKAITEPSYCKGYWEWLEDILGRHEEMLRKKKIYDAIYASLFSYDWLASVMRYFCEFWSSSTNALHTSAGERSISLWDLRQLGGLPIRGLMYDEVVPSAEEKTGVDKDSMLYLLVNCHYLFFAYHRLQAESKKGEVRVDAWVNFWFRGEISYRKSTKKTARNKTQRPAKNNNPIGVIGPVQLRTAEQEQVFAILGVKETQKELVERVAKYLDESEALDLFRRCDNLAMDHFAQREGEHTELIDDGELGGWQIEYLISIRSGPNLMSIVRHWESLVRENTQSKLKLPKRINCRSIPVTEAYQGWWAKVHVETFSGGASDSKRKNRLASPMDDVPKVLRCKPNPKVSGARHRPQPIEILEGDGTEDQLSTERNSDRCWKHVASDRAKSLHPVAPFTAQVNAGTFFDGVLSSSRSFPRELRSCSHFEALNNVEEPQGSSDSIQGPDSFDLVASQQANVDEVASAVPQLTNSNKSSYPPLSVDKGASLSLLGDQASFEKLPTLQAKFEELYKEFVLLGVDYSPLQKRIESSMGSAAKYISIQAEYSKSMTSASQSERLTSISHQISQESGFMEKDVESVQVMRRERNSIDAKCIQLRRELGNLEACSVQLGTSIEEIEVQASQRQATIDHLVKERVAIEQAQLVTEGELQVASRLQSMLEQEREEIKQTPWI
ncbi:hypothetical protein Vadar_004031 [Vaccinium darrowii]|uniref:Uncharacterized protein n=1 Tax=Vaccinium darrowii TaxID=229202 RepID=A0ACB7X7F7_9ERIC|nr:hypothetical protein Vadar_004031 [Vaccinium darrowii]